MSARGVAAALLYVPQSLLEQREHVFVVEGVEDHPPLTSRPHDAGAAQQAELMRHGGLADAQTRGNVTDTELAGRQDIENAHPGAIAQYPEDLGQPFDVARIHC